MLLVLKVALALVIACCTTAAASAGTILRGQLADPVALNIGLICQWNEECMADHKIAMQKALKFVVKYRPPQWRIEQCNRNASRGGKARVDWIGFNQCVRNEDLRYNPPVQRALVTKARWKRKKPAN
jgi:hypothetical protein